MKSPFRLGDRPTIAQIFGLLLVPALMGVVLGAGAGGLLGAFSPQLYQSWFDESVEPVSMGAVLGGLQLGVIGLLIGAFVVVIIVIKADR